ncbi:phage tail spike protein [Senegalia massiliensis]|uniref:Tail spike domain-containing protein n=1 Tax=Senegalia massiliensis TaxID=1720316 RepID=A0A845QUQ1_9CLOT|nr:phage tail spike protein [Senegalia massiliensis]NBI05760.1 hypothetical protein [Senegalia massiliensis]
MIKLFEKDAIDFKSNGLGILKSVIRAEGEEVLNSKFFAEFDILYDKEEKWREVYQERIIFSDGQPFRIYNIRKNLSGITVYTRHIFWDLIHNEVRDIRPNNKNCLFAMQNVLYNTNYPHNFTAYSDIDRLNTQYFINRNPVNCFISDDSIITRWKGELKLDKFKISILNQRGRDVGITIKYRKNMQDIDVEENYDDLITRMRPKGYDGLELPEIYVDSQYINNYREPYIEEVEFPDIKINEDEGITESMAINNLRAAALKYYENTECDIPKTNIKVDMVLLENTVEYKKYKDLVRVEVGDIVTCQHLDLGIDYKAKIIRIKKNHLTGKNAEVELGSFKENLNNSFSKIENTFKDISNTIKNNKTDLQKAIDEATQLLTSALGGYVVKRNGELLIMDTEDPATATHVWRWNLNGLGYSSTGINGPYGLAMTIDGKIVADFITTGTLNAGLIKAGIISSSDNSSWWNVESGEFNFKDKIIFQDNEFTMILSNGKTIEDNISDSEASSKSYADDINSEIQQKFDTGKFPLTGTHYKFDGNSFTIGGGDNIAMHKKDYSTYAHRDGSYTKIGYDGLERFVGSSGKTYHYLIDIITFIQGTAGSARWIQLPDAFKGKRFSVYLAIADSMQPPVVDQVKYSIQRIVATQHPDYSIDYKNARVPIIAYKTNVKLDGSYNKVIDSVQGMLIAIY